jgi:hypothetical protein
MLVAQMQVFQESLIETTNFLFRTNGSCPMVVPWSCPGLGRLSLFFLKVVQCLSKVDFPQKQSSLHSLTRHHESSEHLPYRLVTNSLSKWTMWQVMQIITSTIHWSWRGSSSKNSSKPCLFGSLFLAKAMPSQLLALQFLIRSRLYFGEECLVLV